MSTRLAADIHDELVLDQIRETWDTLFGIEFADHAYHAHRLTGGPLLTSDTPGGLASAIWADYACQGAR